MTCMGEKTAGATSDNKVSAEAACLIYSGSRKVPLYQMTRWRESLWISLAMLMF
jgi:hypothetical protein